MSNYPKVRQRLLVLVSAWFMVIVFVCDCVRVVETSLPAK
jgi:hypothetical protein